MSLILYTKGDLFQLTKNTTKTKGPIILAHACNCHGAWGGGIAYIFRQKFQSSYKLYKAHCTKPEFKSNPDRLLGTSFIVPVSPNDKGFVHGVGEDLLIVCLFTADFGGESHDEIANYTELAMLDLKRQLENPDVVENETVKEILKRNGESGKVLINMPKINAGIFGVPWGFTQTALKKSGLNCNVFEL